MAKGQRGGRPSKRLHILCHAVTLASKSGPQGFTLDNICEQSGISKGGVLYHFSNVAELVRDTFEFYVTSQLPGWIEQGYVSIQSPNLDAPSFNIEQCIDLLAQVPLNAPLERLLLHTYSHTPLTLPYTVQLQRALESASPTQQMQFEQALGKRILALLGHADKVTQGADNRRAPTTDAVVTS